MSFPGALRFCKIKCCQQKLAPLESSLPEHVDARIHHTHPLQWIENPKHNHMINVMHLKRTACVSARYDEASLQLALDGCKSLPQAACYSGGDSILLQAVCILEAAHRDPLLQMGLLRKNWWLLKPVDGANGKGIHLLTDLHLGGSPSLPMAECRGRAAQGYIVQKYVERPHLDPAQMGEASNAPSALYKYNLRILAAIRWDEVPSIWVYEEGYINLCAEPYAHSEAGAHISNLPGSSVCKRMWSTRMFSKYLARSNADVWGDHVLPSIKKQISRIVSAASPLRGPKPSPERTRQPWKRFGFDFMLDEDLHVWLIEANHRPGMSCPKGPAGEEKRSLLEPCLEMHSVLTDSCNS